MTPTPPPERGRPTPIRYRGVSMRPLFQDMDRLTFRPIGKKGVRKGDVVLFVAPDTGQMILHRVVFFKGRQVGLRGDNNREMDSFFLSPSEILGVVVAVSKPHGSFPVMGGAFGLFLHHLFRAKGWLTAQIGGPLRPLWRFLVFMRPLWWVRGFLPGLRLIFYRRAEGEERLIMTGPFLVARKKPGWDKWGIRPFFQLVFDEKRFSRRENQ